MSESRTGYLTDKDGKRFYPITSADLVYDPVSEGKLSESILKFAHTDGTYTGMTTGHAQNLVALKADATEESGASFLQRTTAGNTTIPSNGTTIIKKIVGNMNAYLQAFKPTAFRSVGYNQWNGVIAGAKVDSTGKIVSDTTHVVAIVPCIPTENGSGKNNGYRVEWGDNATNTTIGNVAYIGSTPAINAQGTLLSANTTSGYSRWLPTQSGYLCFTLNATDGFCAHFCWSGDRSGYEDTNTQEITIPLLPWGLAKVGTTADSVEKLSDTQMRLYQRTKRLLMSELQYTMSSVSGETGTTYTYQAEISDMVSGSTIATDYSEAVTVNAKSIVITSGTLKSVDELLAAISGKSVHYILETPIMTIVDSASAVSNSDYGSEWWIGSTIAPTSVDMLYGADYLGWLRDDHKSLEYVQLVAAAAIVELNARISAIETKLSEGIASVIAEKLVVNRGAHSIQTGTSAPTYVPEEVGEWYVDSTNKKLYVSMGNSATTDWVILN